MHYLLFFVLIFYSCNVAAVEVNVADKAVYQVQVAQTRKELETGLMFVKSLSKEDGMLFDLRQYPQTEMWMKNTYIPLDMIFIDCDYRVVDIKADCQPESEEPIRSNRPFCYVLEISGGEVANKRITIGDKLKF